MTARNHRRDLARARRRGRSQRAQIIRRWYNSLPAEQRGFSTPWRPDDWPTTTDRYKTMTVTLTMCGTAHVDPRRVRVRQATIRRARQGRRQP